MPCLVHGAVRLGDDVIKTAMDIGQDYMSKYHATLINSFNNCITYSHILPIVSYTTSIDPCPSPFILRPSSRILNPQKKSSQNFVISSAGFPRCS